MGVSIIIRIFKVLYLLTDCNFTKYQNIKSLYYFCLIFKKHYI